MPVVAQLTKSRFQCDQIWRNFPTLAKHYGYSLRVYFVLGKSLNPTAQIFNFVNGPIFKRYFSHLVTLLASNTRGYRVRLRSSVTFKHLFPLFTVYLKDRNKRKEAVNGRPRKLVRPHM